MASSSERWIDGLQFSSLFLPPSQDAQQRKAQITAYVEYFGQFTSEQFPDDIVELIHNRYPSDEKCLFDDVLATFVLYHPEHGQAIILPIISYIIDGTLVYSKSSPPFASFISLVCPSDENEYSEQWALACGELLRILTHYNRPIYKVEQQNGEINGSSGGSYAMSGGSIGVESSNRPLAPLERKPLRLLSPWITDILRAAPLSIRSDYFRWCSGVMGKYAAGELKPPTIAFSHGSGKHPQLMRSTTRWAVANGAAVILSVCDDEVARYETATLSAVAVPALLLPPPSTPLDEHLVARLPALEPYACLFHRYYAIATPSVTLRLLLGLLESPPSWAPDALDAAVQLVELLQAAEDYASGIRLPRNWMHLHFLHAIGTAMSMRDGIAADAAAALLFRILSQPAFLFPPVRQVEGVEVQHEPLEGYISSYRQQREVPAAEATIEATAQGIAHMLCAHGPEVEWRICSIWEAAYGLIPLASSAVDLPEIIVATPLQPPTLSWNLFIPLLKVLEYLPCGSPSEACLMKIFVATVEAILQRTFPPESSREHARKTKYLSGIGSASKTLAVAELHTMVHSLFLESCASVELASRLLFVVLTVCVSHEAQSSGNEQPKGEESYSPDDTTEDSQLLPEMQSNLKSKQRKRQGPVAALDSYLLAAVCALSCELQLFPFISRGGNHSVYKDGKAMAKPAKVNGSATEIQCSIDSAIHHTHRILAILEALFSLKPSSIGTSWSYCSNEIVAAHVSDLFRRSKACMRAFSFLMQCKWDNEICSRASSLYNLIDIHGKAVASIVNKAEPLEAHIYVPVWKDSFASFGRRKLNKCIGQFYSGQRPGPPGEESTHSEAKLKHTGVPQSSEGSGSNLPKAIVGFPRDASDLVNFLMMGGHIGLSCNAKVLSRSLLSEKQELCFSVVSLLWLKLISGPEAQTSMESISGQQGWWQVERELQLQPRNVNDDEQGKKMWIINRSIVKMIVELMRNHDIPRALLILASASDLLLCATDGMFVDGEACTLPQVEETYHKRNSLIFQTI